MAPPPAGSRRPDRIHLINPFWDAAGGSEWHALALYELLKDRGEVELWSEHEPDRRLLERFPIRRLRPWRAAFPKSGVLVFVGVYETPGHWVRWTAPRRIVLVYNTFAEDRLRAALARLAGPRGRAVEQVFVSELLKQSIAGARGAVLPSLIDLEEFEPAPRALAPPDDGRFVVGRLSRDVRSKHHKLDAPLYRRLATEGCEVRIMGGTTLAEAVGGAAGVTLLPACAEPAARFLHGLDCFFFRTARGWRETQCRVVQEAMACALPVVCHADGGGHVEFIEHGKNGFLFREDAEAWEILMRLQREPTLRAKVGVAARKSMEKAFGAEKREQVARYYTHGPG